MSALAMLRRWRHGRLKSLGPIWTSLGLAYRFACRILPAKPVAQLIGPYGPFLLQPEFAFSNFESWGGAHNSGFRACVEACRGAQCVIDVGGHIGLVTLPMSRVVAPDGSVFTFEPAVANVSILKKHLADNKIENVKVIESLVGRIDDDHVAFFEERGASGMNGLTVKGNRDRYIRTQHKQISLDSFCASHGLSPQIIKIDVEGAEYQVLQGAVQTLQRCAPRVFLSIHPAHLRLLGTDTNELLALIDSIGYSCREIDGSPVKSYRLDEYLLLPKDKVMAC